jgi:tetratricopeptide (TPR) repeat protein
MHRSTVLTLVIVVAVAIGLYFYAGQRTATPPEPDLGPVGATLLEGLGEHGMPVTHQGAAALQRWFDQGLMLAYGFNHDAAERSFLKATELDPQCAMCWWGAALVLGPHVNAPMDPDNNAKAWSRLQKALALAPQADEREQAYIQALAARYAEKPPEDRQPLDRAYADAMAGLAQRYPDDLDAVTLYAEALMDLQPWDYWDAQQQPVGETTRIVSQLESVLARNPDHPGALHLYIHAVEASPEPQRGVDAADRLRELVPGSGHLVHMPAHIYTRVGRYNDAVIANQKAIEADDAYLATCRPAPGVYPLGYVPHNHHFLWWTASMQGESATALAAAKETAKRAWLPELIRAPDMAFLQDYWITPLKARVQFQRWDDIRATAAPEEDLAYPMAIWHFAQGMAAVHGDEMNVAADHMKALAAAAADPAFEQILIGPRHPLSTTLKIAERVLAGTLAQANKDYPAAIAALEQGVTLEDGAAYFEPPLWHQPVRQKLGAVLLAAARPADAEAVFREDLRRNPDNGWSLYGLEQALLAQKRAGDAAQVARQLQRAWAHADTQLTLSSF